MADSLETRQERLTTFHRSYVQLIEARSRGDDQSAHQSLLQMADIATPVQRDLDRVGQGVITLMDAPAAGGRHTPVRLTDLVLHPEWAERYNIDPNMVSMMIRRGASDAAMDTGTDWEQAIGGCVVAAARAPFAITAAVVRFLWENAAKVVALATAATFIAAAVRWLI